ncbi:copper homeostasis protein CutC [bacterium]|nr:copper homeostasis protein CutC [bacterium]
MSSHGRILLEVCVASVQDALAAASAGADRLELNMAMELGGLTPTIGLLGEVKRAVEIPVVAMVRCRPGGFCYSSAELGVMLNDAELLLAAGADGIVSGALHADRTLDENFWQSLKFLSNDRPLVFHRALDATADPHSLLQKLVDLGTTRVLTSGGCATAWEGREQIVQFQNAWGNQIEILVGSGVSPANAVSLIRYTGCSQVHGSFSQLSQDPFGYVGSQIVRETSKHLVSATRVALDSDDSG